MVERFFATSRAAAGDPAPSPATALLSGPPSCGKTSLLFQFAVNCASEGDAAAARVVFICSRKRWENKPPFSSPGTDLPRSVLQRIQMKYVEDDDAIKKYFAAFHLHKSFPTAVIVDDFGDFFEERNCQARYGNTRGRDLAIVHTLALCRDAIDHANQILQDRRPCTLLISDTHQGDTPRLLFIYRRWMQCIFTVQSAGPGSFLLKNSTTKGNNMPCFGRRSAREIEAAGDGVEMTGKRWPRASWKSSHILSYT